MAETDEWEEWFERVWRDREDKLYPSLFGAESKTIFPIPWERLSAAGVADPRWNTCGVLKFHPTESRGSWLYVSSGLSNAWFDERPDPEAVSGFGCEFVLETDTDAEWPIHRLHQLMVYQLAIFSGKLGDSEPLNFYHRIPGGGPIDWKCGDLTTVMLVPPTTMPSEFHQESGYARFLSVTAINEREVQFARDHGGDALLERLCAAGAYPVLNPARSSVV